LFFDDAVRFSLRQWTQSGVIGASGPNVVRVVAEEYNDVSAPVVMRSSVATVAMATSLNSKSAT